LHLLAGTTADNTRDMMERGRHRCGRVQGSKHGRSKLTEDHVRQIRAEYGGFRKHPNLSELATKFGVTKDMVSNIIRRDNWKHI